MWSRASRSLAQAAAMFFPLYDLNPHRRWPLVTMALIVANALALVWMVQLPAEQQVLTPFVRGFVPARLRQLQTGQPLVIDLQKLLEGQRHLPVAGQVQVPQAIRLDANAGAILSSLLTCMFLHGGLMHLLGNMWFLWIFGNNVEDRLGHVWFLLFYLTGGLLASACHWLTGPDSTVPVIGASGAVATVLGAYAVTWPSAKVRTLVFLGIFITTWDLPAMAFLGLWFVMQLVEANLAMRVGLGVGGGVAWWAHVGGFLAGVVLMPLLFGNWGRSRRGDAWAVLHQDSAVRLPETPTVWSQLNERSQKRGRGTL